VGIANQKLAFWSVIGWAKVMKLITALLWIQTNFVVLFV
jgi:hypothetical protein